MGAGSCDITTPTDPNFSNRKKHIIVIWMLADRLYHFVRVDGHPSQFAIPRAGQQGIFIQFIQGIDRTAVSY